MRRSRHRIELPVAYDAITVAVHPDNTAVNSMTLEELSKRSRYRTYGYDSCYERDRFSDYTAFMYLGEMIEFEETRDLFANPKHQLTNDYLYGKIGLV